MRFEATSSEAALAANGKIINAATPWHLIVDTDEETITVRKRNLIMIGVDEDVLAFRYIRRIRIDQHLVGADIEIKAVGGSRNKTISIFFDYVILNLKNTLLWQTKS